MQILCDSRVSVIPHSTIILPKSQGQVPKADRGVKRAIVKESQQMLGYYGTVNVGDIRRKSMSMLSATLVFSVRGARISSTGCGTIDTPMGYLLYHEDLFCQSWWKEAVKPRIPLKGFTAVLKGKAAGLMNLGRDRNST